jgi:hypothetical protein
MAPALRRPGSGERRVSIGQRALVALLVAVILGYGVYWFFDTFEKVEQEVSVGLRGAAARNPLLAAERFLNRLDLQASSHESLLDLADLPPRPGVLVTIGERLTLSESEHRRLLDWVSGGGHLIAKVRGQGSEAPTDEETENRADPTPAPRREPADPLLRAAGYGLVTPDGDWEERADDLPVDLSLPGGPALLVDLDRGRSIAGVRPGDIALGSALGDHLVSRRYGDGRLTLLTDTAMLGNDHIGEHDHATLLAWLMGLQDEPRAVWLVHGDDMIGLGAWLWRHARAVLLTAAVLIALWIAGRTQRFGPVLGMPSPDRRRITEHIQAAGEFYWRHGQSGDLLAQTRSELLKRLERRYPELRQGGFGDRVHRIAELSGLSLTAVSAALETPPAPDPDRYTTQAQGLQLIGKRL